ncbi:MAG TPA: hypothetical protein DGG94_14530 [Micromonosporaceae bacterium]|nr:hypothetical protein [Micromonosporaceae bacterium]HCU50989.1 hypothetical protein [Micromonosporaceae bacterium]
MRPLLLLLLGLFVPAVVAPSPAAAASYCDGRAYLVYAEDSDSPSTLLSFDPATGVTEPVIALPVHLNALAASGDVFYAIARNKAVRVTADGIMTALGPIQGAPANNFSGAHAGAIHDDRWLLMHDERVYTIALDTMSVTNAARLTQPLRIGDWAADDQGRLLALSTLERPTELVSVDPATGAVETLSRPAGLPGGSSFGAVWILGDQLYAWHNGKDAIYRIDLTQPDSAILVASGLGTGSTDGAACAAPPASPAPPLPAPITAPARLLPVAPPDGVLITPDTTPSVLPRTPRRPAPPPQAQPAIAAGRATSAEEPKDSQMRTRKWVAAAVVVLTMAGLLGLRSQSSRQ